MACLHARSRSYWWLASPRRLPRPEAAVTVQARQRSPWYRAVASWPDCGLHGSDVRPQVGIIQKRPFTGWLGSEGRRSSTRSTPASYQASYDSARGTGTGRGGSASARPGRALSWLAAIDAISKQDADDAEATLRQYEAAVVAAGAALQTAKINLDYTHIRALISGRIGTSTYTPGALVTASQTLR